MHHNKIYHRVRGNSTSHNLKGCMQLNVWNIYKDHSCAGKGLEKCLSNRKSSSSSSSGSTTTTDYLQMIPQSGIWQQTKSPHNNTRQHPRVIAPANGKRPEVNEKIARRQKEQRKPGHATAPAPARAQHLVPPPVKCFIVSFIYTFCTLLLFRPALIQRQIIP
uniref:Uncharacterized protein n=1 Tax=Anopheles farauti TaxID=69004 RepID=A0A182QEZ7_9DIPT